MTSWNGNIFRETGLCADNSPVQVNSPRHKGQWRGALMFSLICAWINDWVNNREAGDLRRRRGHYDVKVMNINISVTLISLQNPRCSSVKTKISGEIIPNLFQTYIGNAHFFLSAISQALWQLHAHPRARWVAQIIWVDKLYEIARALTKGTTSWVMSKGSTERHFGAIAKYNDAIITNRKGL